MCFWITNIASYYRAYSTVDMIIFSETYRLLGKVSKNRTFFFWLRHKFLCIHIQIELISSQSLLCVYICTQYDICDCSVLYKWWNTFYVQIIKQNAENIFYSVHRHINLSFSGDFFVILTFNMSILYLNGNS
jgi:hypothetical protein